MICWHSWKKINLNSRPDFIHRFRRCRKCGAVQVHCFGPWHPEGWCPLYSTSEYTWPRDIAKVRSLWEEHGRRELEAEKARRNAAVEKFFYSDLEDAIMLGEFK